MEKDGEDNRKVGKVCRTINQSHVLRLEYDKIRAQAQWVSDILLESMLENMVQMLRDGILKLNHLFFDELFKRRKTHTC